MNANSNINEMRQSTESVSPAEINTIKTHVIEDIQSLKEISQQNPNLGALIMQYVYNDQTISDKYKSFSSFDDLLNALQPVM